MKTIISYSEQIEEIQEHIIFPTKIHELMSKRKTANEKEAIEIKNELINFDPEYFSFLKVEDLLKKIKNYENKSKNN